MSDPSVHGVLKDIATYIRYQAQECPSEIQVRSAVLASIGSRTPAAAPAAPTPVPPPPPPPAPRVAPAPAVPGNATPSDALRRIADRIAACTRCRLHEGRTRTVPGQGSASPELMFVGEGPGAEEDRQGLAFVGAAGQLLTKMIQAMGFEREQVFIGNIVKCRPPDNRPPQPDEMAACLPYLREQISALRPRVIVALGATATRGLLNTTQGITSLRGTWQQVEGIPVMPTYHPAYLLRMPAAKRDAWADLQAVLGRLGRTPPTAQKRKETP